MIDKLIGAQGSRGNRRFFNENIRDCFEMLKVWEFRGMARDEKKKRNGISLRFCFVFPTSKKFE